MKRFTVLVFIIFSAAALYAQDRTTNNLQLLLSKEKTDTGKVKLMISIGDQFGFGMKRNDSSFWYLQQALDLAQKAKYVKGEIRARYNMTSYLTYTGNYPEALRLSLDNLAKASEVKDYDALFFQTRQTGWIYSGMGDHKKELDYQRKLMDLADSGIFRDTATIELYKWIANNCIAEAFSRLHAPDSALKYELLIYHLPTTYSSSEIQARLALSTSELGVDYFQLKKYDSAFFFYRKSIPSAVRSHRLDVLARSELGMAVLFRKTGQRDSALFYAREALKALQNTDDPQSQVNADSLIAELYQSSHQYDSAFKYMHDYVVLKDSVYNQNKILQAQNLSFDQALQEQELVQAKKQAQQQYKNSIRFYLLLGVVIVVLIITFLLLRNIRSKRKANDLLHKKNEQIQKQKDNLESTLSELKSTQSQLIQSEKMASLGELTAGIAHEIQNPLNFVNNFSDVNAELISELVDEVDKGNYDEVKVIAKDIKENEQKINHHGKRADSIVKGMLQHSRSSTGVKEPTDINALADEYLRLAYQSIKAKDKDFTAEIKTDFDATIGKINIIPQDVGRVLLNLYNNAFYVVTEKQKACQAELVEAGYQPAVTVSTKKINGKVEIKVADNGNGIPRDIIDKIFQPFFTTKPTGSGTGLGLSLSYDIVKAHGGEIKVGSKENEGTIFSIHLPITVQ